MDTPADRQQKAAVRRLTQNDGTISLSTIAGDDWDGFYIGADGLLYNPMWRRGFSAADLKAQFWTLQRLPTLEHAAARYKREREAAIKAQESAEDRAAWYRRQLVLESRAGSMLARILEPSDHA